jgi:hypothetical protein
MFGDYQEKARATISAQVESLALPGLLTEELGTGDVMDTNFAALNLETDRGHPRRVPRPDQAPSG